MARYRLDFLDGVDNDDDDGDGDDALCGIGDGGGILALVEEENNDDDDGDCPYWSVYR